MTLHSRPHRVSHVRRARATLLIVGVTLVVAAFLPALSTAATSTTVAGTAGVNPSPPDTSSALTVKGHGTYASLSVTVSQTADLVNQTIGVRWAGAPATTSDTHPPGQPFGQEFDHNWLAIFQCWGDPSPSDPLSAVDQGPAPTECEAGGAALNGAKAYPQSVGTLGAVPAATRIIAHQGDPNYAAYLAAGGVQSPYSNELFEPFIAVDGTTVGVSQNSQAVSDPTATFWLNPYFSYNTTNEVPFARTFSDGTGSALFIADTGLEAPGLGCGQTVQPTGSGGKKVPQCWLVAVPVPDSATSPVSPGAWANRISIPLNFRSVDSPCTFGKTEIRLEGSELAQPAISSWQPTLCAAGGSVPYDYSALGDSTARSDLPTAISGAAQMAVMSSPLDPTTLTPGTSAVYSPLTLSALTIAFNIQRVPANDPKTGQALTDELPFATTNVATIKLTPRVVAKLLSESYRDEFQGLSSDRNNPLLAPDGKYRWLQSNAHDLFSDPDFQQFNPEFTLLQNASTANASQLAVEFNSADAYATLWQWVVSDREAAIWLAGGPDQWGMQVNPYYSTNASLNPTGVGLAPSTLSNFPKSDPYTEIIAPTSIGGSAVEGPNILYWNPYANTMSSAALETSTSDVGSKVTPNVNAISAGSYFSADGAERVGQRAVLSVTDSASAAKYGLQTALLSQDNQDSSSRSFIAADYAGMLAGLKAMAPSSAAPGVMVPQPQVAGSGAYPLTHLTYGVVIPENMTTSDRASYTRFLRYAAGPGQISGTAFGQLPPGYVPLPRSLTAQTETAISAIDGAPLPGATAPTAPTASAMPSVPRSTPGSEVSSPLASTPAASPLVSPQATTNSAPPPTSSAPLPTSNPAAHSTVPSPPQRQILAASKTPATAVGASRWAAIAALGLLALATAGALVRRPRRRTR